MSPGSIPCAEELELELDEEVVEPDDELAREEEAVPDDEPVAVEEDEVAPDEEPTLEDESVLDDAMELVVLDLVADPLVLARDATFEDDDAAPPPVLLAPLLVPPAPGVEDPQATIMAANVAPAALAQFASRHGRFPR